ncbi:MAG TPA: alpha/beta fold hydrolase [Micromonosporaceae bacterium]
MVALALVIVGTVLLTRTGDTRTRAVLVNGVPMLEVTSDGPQAGAGVVVAHGFAGSARLMRPFADTLARRGYLVVVPDLAGHGANTAPLTEAAIDHDLAAAVDYLRQQRELTPDRIALVGHSMGAGAVTRYAVAHPDIAVTVAISLPSARNLPADPARPRNLLALVGGLEFAGFRTAAAEAVGLADPDAGSGPVGDPAAGTARQAVVVPGVEHISILFSASTHERTVAWIDAAFGRSGTGPPPHPADRLFAAGVLLTGLLLGFVPLSRWVLGQRGRPVPVTRMTDGGSKPMPRRFILAAGAVIGCAVAVAGAQWLPTNTLPLAVGGYTAGFFLTVGAVLIAMSWLVPGDVPASPATGAETGRTVAATGQTGATSGRTVVASALLTGYSAAAIAVPMHTGFTSAVPSGPRWWLLPIVVVSAGALLLGAELGARRLPLGVSAILLAAVAATFVATMVGTAPGFILLVLPLLVVLFAWHVAWSAWLRRVGAPVWSAVLVGAVVIGWPIATTLPLT